MADVEIRRIPRIDVKKAGTLVGTRPAINLIEGTNITLTVTDDGASNEVDVEIAASGGGGSPAGSNTEIQYNNSGAFGADSRFRFDSAIPGLIVGQEGSQFSIFAKDATGAVSNDGTDISIGTGFSFDDGLGSAASGGSMDVYSGAGVNGGNGGPISLSGGSSDSGNGATISITAGSSTVSGFGGPIVVTAGNGNAGGGGAIDLYAGNSDSATPGSISLNAGIASTQGNGGGITLLAKDGVGTNANGGDLNITVGLATGSGTPGALKVTNTGSAVGTGNVTVGNVAPGTTAISVTAWMRITVDGSPYLLPLFS